MTRVRRSFAASVGGLPRTFWWLWTGTLISRTGGFVLPFLAFYVVDGLGYSAGFAGLVVASAGLGSIGAALGGGVLADRIGRRPVLLGSQLLSAVTLVGLGLSESRPALLGWAAAYGLTHNASRPAYSAMMTDIVAPADRIRAFSLHFWAINLGFAIAPTLAGLLAGFGYLTLFVADAAATTVVAVLVYLRVPESLPSPAPRVEGVRQDRGSLLDVLRDRVFMSYVLLTLGFALIFMQHLSTVPVQMRADGLTPAQYGAIIAVNGILIVLVTVPLTRALQRFPRARVMAVSSLLVGGGFAATALADAPKAYVLTVVIWTLGEVIGAGVGPSIVADLSPASMRARYQGVFSLSFSVAAFAAPLGGAAVYDRLGGTVLWASCGVLGAVLAVGHLAIGPARGRRLVELGIRSRATGTDAVPVPGPVTAVEADEATR